MSIEIERGAAWRVRSARVALVALALAAAACQPERSAPAATVSATPAAPAPPPLPYVPDPTGPFVKFEAAGVPSYTLVRDRGLGIVALDPGPALAGRVADTLEVRVRPEPDAGVLARLSLDTTGVFTFEAREGTLAAPGALEFGYEQVGFPIVEHRAGGWERVHVGTATDGTEVTGWTHAQRNKVAITLWEDVLVPGLPIFFALPPDSIRFYEAPEGAETPFALNPNDYILWPIETRGDWMRVRAATPSDYCTTTPPTRQDSLWIRWRGESGRPRVWFYTKGC